MRQILLNMQGAVVARMPRPDVPRGHVLVQVQYSFVSVGTEIAPLRPAQVAAPDATAVEIGLARAKLMRHYLKASIKDPRKAARRITRIARQRFDRARSASPAGGGGSDQSAPRLSPDVLAQGWAVGYAAAGEVVELGDGVSDLAVGNLVACAGAGQANHADYISVPRNLVCRIPAGCALRDAAATTLGAIAMQGVRRAAPQLGERVAVLGLGFIGQITAQLLRAAGCTVVGLDLDPARVARARTLGMDAGAASADELEILVRDLTGGRGCDRALVTAATKSNAVINLAMEVTRAKGTVVIVGDVGLGVERPVFYRKEIDLLMSTSYGPGRYDADYEVEGHDYPYAYVRWTLNRNMQSFLELVASGRVVVSSLIDTEVPVESAPAVYDELARGGETLPLGVVITYRDAAPRRDESTGVTLGGHRAAAGEPLRYALVGAGSFALGMLVPQLRRLNDRYFLGAVVSRTGTQGSNFAREERVEVLTSRLDDVLQDERIALVVIATRHHEHADAVARAIAAGKHVFVEKPLAIDWSGLEAVATAYRSTSAPPAVMVGFNRRFSPALEMLRRRIEERRSPLVMEYRLNAGYIPLDHWVHGAQGGGRNIGEACHMYDVFRFLSGAPVASVTAASIDPGQLPYARNDNFSATVGYADGSLGTLVYTALGPKSGMGKEHLTVFVDGEAFVVDDYRRLTRVSDGAVLWQSGEADKGHFEELKQLGDSIVAGRGAPIPFDEIIETTAVSLQVEDLLLGRADA